MNQWSFSISNFDIIITILAMAVFTYFAIRNFRNTNNKMRTSLIEITRLITIFLLCITLFEPEFITREVRTEKPVIKILHDSSNSMKTKDIADSAKNTKSRLQAIQEVLKDESLTALRAKYDVICESFAADDGSNANTNISSALDKNLSAKNLKSIILISDGDWNKGEDPINSATRFRSKNIPLFTIATGSDSYLPDLILDKAEAPAFCIINEKVMIPFTVTNHLNRTINTTIQMISRNGIKFAKAISLAPGARLQDSLMWQPTETGNHEFKLQIPLQSDETFKDNNSIPFKIAVRSEQLRVLIIESRPRWEYRYLRNALMRDPGVTVNTLLFQQDNMKRGGGPGYISIFPEAKELLSLYDVIFLGDVGIKPKQLTLEQSKLIRGLVEKQGSGLVFMPGSSGAHFTFEKSELNDLLPVILDKNHKKGISYQTPSKMVLTPYGGKHLLTLLADHPSQNHRLWKNLPGFYWCSAIEKAKPGTHVLARHSSARNKYGKRPLLVTKPFGNGLVLFMGTDSAWRWRKGVEDKYHYRFWGQVVRWMAHKRHLAYNDGIRLFFSPETPLKGDTVTLKATILDKMRMKDSKLNVICKIFSPSKKESIINMRPDGEDWGVYKSTFKTTEAGSYKLEISCAETKQSFTTIINVTSTEIEKMGQPAQFRSLQEIAQISSAKFATIANFKDIINAIDQLPDENIIEHRLKIWCQWWWGLVIVILLGAYWIQRKSAGLI